MATTTRSAPARWPAGAGMAARVRAHPWEHTALGPINDWPPTLQNAVETLLRLPVPAVLTWGSDELLLFNDAFAELGDTEGADLLGSAGIDRALLHAHCADRCSTAVPLLDDSGQVAGSLTFIREAISSDPEVLAAARSDRAQVLALEHNFALLESMMVERATDLTRANEELSANIVARSVADDERKTLRRQLVAAEEAERGRLSRELHDQLGQHLTAIALGLHEVASLVRPNSQARSRLGALQELTTLLTRDARYLAIELRPPELDDVGIESAIASYVELWSKRYGVAVELQSAGIVRFQYSGDVATTIYRILQEALTNVAKHANARAVSVILEHTDGELRLIVEDDGDGFDVEEAMRRASSERRMGILGMRERSSLVGGTLTTESSPGSGTTIYARLPLA